MDIREQYLDLARNKNAVLLMEQLGILDKS